MLSTPTASAHECEEDTTEDLHTALARTTAWIDFTGHPLQDMWGALMHIGKRTEQLQIKLHRTVEELRMLNLQLGQARLSMGEEHRIYLQLDQSIIWALRPWRIRGNQDMQSCASGGPTQWVWPSNDGNAASSRAY